MLDLIVSTAMAASDEVYEGVAADVPGKAEYLWFPAEIWLLIALAILAGIFFAKGGAASVKKMTDERAERIRGELEEARRLKDEAEDLLQRARHEHRDAIRDAEEIVAAAKQRAETMQKEAVEALEAQASRRETQVMDKIARAEATAMAELRSEAARVALAATSSLLAEKMQGDAADRLLDEAIDNLSNKLH